MIMRPNRWMLLLLSGLVAIGSLGCAPGGPVSATVTTLVVAEKPLDPQVTLEGVLVPAQTAVISSRISGQIESVPTAAGAQVKAGQVLATLDRRALEAQLNQAQAGLQTAKASQEMAAGQVELTKIALDAAQKNYDRIQALFQSGAAAQSQLDDALDKLNTSRTQYRNASGPSQSQASASVSTAGANISNLTVQLDYTVLRSPVDGVITLQNAVIGETVSPGAPVITVADLSTLKLKGMISQEMLPTLVLNQPVTVTVGIYPDTPVAGLLTGIGPTAAGTGELFPIEVTVPNDGKLMAGMTASASLEIQGRKGLVIPESAVLKESGKSFAFIIREGIAVKTEILPGLVQNREIEVLKGLAPGDRIAVIGAGSLKDGMQVTVRE